MALGLYMAHRIMGEFAEVQKRRLLRLAECITVEENNSGQDRKQASKSARL